MFADVGPAAITGQPSAGRTEAAAFEQALVDELARDRSFHPVDGRFGSRQEARFDQAIEARSGPETNDPQKTASGGLVEETVAAGAYRRVGFEADVSDTRKTDGDDHAAKGSRPSGRAAFWQGDRVAEAPLSFLGVPDLQDRAPVDSGSSGRVFFNGDGRPIVLSSMETPHPLPPGTEDALSGGDLLILPGGAVVDYSPWTVDATA